VVGRIVRSMFPDLDRTESRLRRLADLYTEIRTRQAKSLDIIAELDGDDAATQTGYSSLAAALSDLLRITPRRASRLISHARALAATVTPTGHRTPARLPIAADAVHAGVLDLDHLDVIADAVRKIPAHAPAETDAIVEQHLVAIARTTDTRMLRRHADVLLARIDQDGPAPRDETELATPRNTFQCQRTLDGRMTFTGDVEPETAEQLDALLVALADPDTRTRQQRDGDAFTEIVTRAIDAPNLPARGGERPHLTVTLDLDTLRNQTGPAIAEGGAPLRPGAVRRLACDAAVIPAVLDGDSVPLDLGRKRRLVTARQRTALVARDQGCAFPTCTAPARWTEAHHIVSWLDGGGTDLANLVLLCRRHHRLIHHSGWEIRVHHGRPEFIPPRWLDPARTPLRSRPPTHLAA
jgi:uncharacterized protein DUF222/HNH endonuclease